MRDLLSAVSLCICVFALAQRQLYSGKKSEVNFTSDAPMERIAATNR